MGGDKGRFDEGGNLDCHSCGGVLDSHRSAGVSRDLVKKRERFIYERA